MVNPFEHHHHHHHDDDDDLMLQDVDPAQQSLADALRVSFRILKYIMVILLIIYAFSNIFTVKQNEVAVRLRFGRIVGETDSQRILRDGVHLGFPYPIEKVMKVDVAPVELSLDRQFWFDVAGNPGGKLTDEIADANQRPLNPEKDGSLLTGDANILHARWSMTYIVSDPVAYIVNLGDKDVAQKAVRLAGEEGVVRTCANMNVDDLINGLSEAEKVEFIKNIQIALNELNTGIEITNLTLSTPTVPLSVREAYRAVINAETELAQQLETAQQERAKILGDTAGEADRALWQLVEDYEEARLADDAPRVAKLEAKMDRVFSDLKIENENGEVAIGGQVAEMINEARTYKTQVVEQVRSDAESFDQLLPLWQQNPRIVESRLWLTVKEEILTGDIETIYVPSGQIYLELNRDPNVRKAMEEKRLKDEEEARRQEAMNEAK